MSISLLINKTLTCQRFIMSYVRHSEGYSLYKQFPEAVFHLSPLINTGNSTDW